MADVRIVHNLACSVDVFWNRLFFDPDFNDQLFLHHLRFSNWKLVEQTETEEFIVRTVEVAPPMNDLPGPLRAVLGSGLTYREQGRFDKKARRYAIKAIPNILTDRLGVEGELFCEPLEAGRCRRIFLARVEARVFGVGGMLEKRILADLSQNYDGSAVFLERYMKEKGIAPT